MARGDGDQRAQQGQTDEQAEVLASRLPDARAGQDTGAAVGTVTLVAGTDLDPEDIR
ncbi:hypothetical protein [Streptomyces sp. NPDC005009]